MTIFDKICDHIESNTGYKISFANDEELDGETRNETRGVLRINNSDRGYDTAAKTENFGMFVEFSVVLDEEEEFITRIRKYMDEWQSLSMDLNDGHIYKIYFTSLQPINYVQKVSGVKFSTYVLQFSLNLFDNAMFSDDVLIKINGNVLQGVIQYVESASYQRDSHVTGDNNIPEALGCTKIRTYTIVYMPVIGNSASNALFEAHDQLSESDVDLTIKFPYYESGIECTPVIDRTASVKITNFSVSLQKGTFGQVTCSLTEYR